jgi:hypothetical protein
MGFYKRRWQPTKAEKRAYAERMRSIEAAKDEPLKDGYTICCTGDCVTGDEIAFFNAGKTEKRLYGTIVNDSYGAEKQQHTFTIELDDSPEKTLIKGRNLYKNGVYRKQWTDEAKRQKILDEKHSRGDEAREAARKRKEERLFGQRDYDDIEGFGEYVY